MPLDWAPHVSDWATIGDTTMMGDRHCEIRQCKSGFDRRQRKATAMLGLKAMAHRGHLEQRVLDQTESKSRFSFQSSVQATSNNESSTRQDTFIHCTYKKKGLGAQKGSTFQLPHTWNRASQGGARVLHQLRGVPALAASLQQSHALPPFSPSFSVSTQESTCGTSKKRGAQEMEGIRAGPSPKRSILQGTRAGPLPKRSVLKGTRAGPPPERSVLKGTRAGPSPKRSRIDVVLDRAKACLQKIQEFKASFR
ncbi:hypothetical protein NL676_004594 [Syzygium grande]|nr:hypothetical protein NL676_004594 [Syzygium grande]